MANRRSLAPTSSKVTPGPPSPGGNVRGQPAGCRVNHHTNSWLHESGDRRLRPSPKFFGRLLQDVWPLRDRQQLPAQSWALQGQQPQAGAQEDESCIAVAGQSQQHVGRQGNCLQPGHRAATAKIQRTSAATDPVSSADAGATHTCSVLLRQVVHLSFS